MSEQRLAEGPHSPAVQLKGRVAPLEDRFERVGSPVEAVDAAHLQRSRKQEHMTHVF